MSFTYCTSYLFGTGQRGGHCRMSDNGLLADSGQEWYSKKEYATIVYMGGM
jgi:hypothetical protein